MNQWDRIKESSHRLWSFVKKNEKFLWIMHSTGAFMYGLFVMLYFNKDFSVVRKLAFFLLGLWLMLIVVDIYAQWEERAGKNRRWVRLALNYVLKNMYQGLYFFMLPFYWESTVWDSVNVIMLALLTVGAVLSTQDLIFDNWLMENRLARGIYYSFCLFGSLLLLIPIVLPLTVDTTLVVAGALSSVGFFSLNLSKDFVEEGERAGLLSGVERKLRSFPWHELVILAILFGFLAWNASGAVPSVPYAVRRSVVTGIVPQGTNTEPTPGLGVVDELDVRDRSLHLLTKVYAPRSPYMDTFLVSWLHEGTRMGTSEVRVIPLGEQDHYLFVSKSPPGMVWSPGRWTVVMKTRGGRLVARNSFYVIRVSNKMERHDSRMARRLQ